MPTDVSLELCLELHRIGISFKGFFAIGLNLTKYNLTGLEEIWSKKKKTNE